MNDQSPIALAGSVELSKATLDRLLPMHLRLSPTGTVLQAGPTLVRVLGECTGESFFRQFRVVRPAGIGQMADLVSRAGERLTLVPQSIQTGPLRGHALLDEDGGVLLNLSFGIGVVDAVRVHALTISDFAVTDLTVEMLYLVEAKNAVMEEFRRLSLRLEGAKTEAEERALTDTLTGLRNRRALDQALARACETGMDFGLMHLDLDKFKQVNDTLGHAAGDHVLRHVASALCDETRSTDTVARVGGDEFVILLPALTDANQLRKLARRLIDRISVPNTYEGATCQVGASIGVTTNTNFSRPKADVILEEADIALYQAKNAGRGTTRIFENTERSAGT